MKIVKAGFIIESDLSSQLLVDIERFGRTCYKSADREINEATAKKFVAMLIKRGHESVLEHGHITVRLVVDRGVSHELVRHRLASYSQESTRYCNYSQDKFDNELTFIHPQAVIDDGTIAASMWCGAMRFAEERYMQLIEAGCSPQAARSVLPASLKTEIVMTANPREWRTVFRLRTADAAHPQMREVMRPMLRAFRALCPVLFDDVGVIA